MNEQEKQRNDTFDFIVRRADEPEYQPSYTRILEFILVLLKEPTINLTLHSAMRYVVTLYGNAVRNIFIVITASFGNAGI
jgi:hypothetical protein